MFEKITSFQNSRVKLIKKLRDKKGREQEKRFVIDAARDLRRAIDHGYEVDFVLYCPPLVNDEETSLVNQLDTRQVFEVTRDILEKVGYRENPSALVTVLHTKPPLKLPLPGDDLGQTVLGLVNLQKPGNIGALLRTADAAGIQAVFLVDTAIDLYNPNIIRSSTGACFLNNVYYLTTGEALTFFTQHHFQMVAAHLEGTQSLFDVVFEKRSAVILGTEDEGLPPVWAERANALVKIPMMGTISDSLNVSVSGAVFMYEVLRQRLQRTMD